jgi:hypothetical protein
MDPIVFDVNMTHYFFSWLIRSKYGLTPKWSPYGESPHGKTLCGVREPMLNCGIMR